LVPEPGERWGILGGSFDPVHLGHTNLAGQVKEHAKLNGVLFVPSYNHPFKPTPAASFDERVEMLQLAIEPHDSFVVSDIERARNLSGFTLDMVQMVKKQFEDVSFYFIIGEDNVRDLIRWHRPEELVAEIPFLVGNRPPHEALSLPEELPADRIVMIPIEMIDISSTEIRKRIKMGESVADLVTPEVYDYIVGKGLYR